MIVIMRDAVMPECCNTCVCSEGYGCGITGTLMETKEMESRPDWCPLEEVEPCEDAVSRKDVVKFLNDWMSALDSNCHHQSMADLKIIKNDFENLPSVTPKQRWILCSEGLPEDEYVLISKKPSKLSGSKWCVAIAIRMEDPRSRKIQWRDSGFGIIQDDKVLAWQPMPEPYREEGGEA